MNAKEVLFDPWEADEKDAAGALIRALANGQDCNGPRNPFLQIDGVSQINADRARVEAGDGGVVMDCVSVCVLHGLVVPPWLADAFRQRYLKVALRKADSWDDPQVFGRPYKKGKHLPSLRKKHEGTLQVWMKIYEAVKYNPETPINQTTFVAVGNELGLGSKLAAECYYAALKEGWPNLKNMKKPRNKPRP